MPRKEPNRTASRATFVRLTDTQRETIDDAIDLLLESAGIPDAKLTIGKFMVAAAVKEAERILVDPTMKQGGIKAWAQRARRQGLESIDTDIVKPRKR